ncbi:gamma-glutamylcyclotransferase family protein [Flavobacterium glaciei]|uniref:Gamma-glutamyl AIG2-like cyclotransferase n=1 Tax=Flavobacterium glaciei TaxID=386300 RepID=A0A562Q212_9FLAO|nr:gamma-glutamylcyclotransferase family protein [Flavobacterium glaciei]RDI57467.1 gamma-glutamyl AIG2-like cyclotransferase [Flavobacterium glaciei]TWI50731.1 gamma-glutamyl AIG2-like cyclotransferase [Flavobacterium glaciei]
MEQLFSYGTLQSKEIQIQVFNKLLSGTEDKLLGYKLKDFQIEEEFGMEDYFVAVPSENASDVINGIAFSVTNEDLIKADQFESNSYKRIQIKLQSGLTAWIYIES